jgi:polysaccharide export outer membrane protein
MLLATVTFVPVAQAQLIMPNPPLELGQQPLEAVKEPPQLQRPQPLEEPGTRLNPDQLEAGSELDAEKFRRYRLGPGDSILVLVQRFPDLSFQGTVNPEGSIVMPLAGTLRLQGLTLAEAQEAIRQQFDRFIIDPEVTLSLLAQRPVQVTVVGEVVRPGFYPIGSTRVSDALLAAGGSLDSADLRHVEVRRTLLDQSVIEQEVDLYTPLAKGEPLPDLRLEDGDVVSIPSLAQLQDPNYDRDLVATSTVAKPTITIRILSYAAGAGGTIVLPSGSSFRDALNGIPLTTANINRIALIRYDPETQEPVKQILNGKKALTGDPEQDVPLQDNDVIVIGRNLITNITYALSRLTQPFRDVLGFLLFFDSLTENATNLFQPLNN